MRPILVLLLLLLPAAARAQSPYRVVPDGIECHGDRLVWLNTETGVYHFPGNSGFGATKEGVFTCEHQAIEQGARPGISDQ